MMTEDECQRHSLVRWRLGSRGAAGLTLLERRKVEQPEVVRLEQLNLSLKSESPKVVSCGGGARQLRSPVK